MIDKKTLSAVSKAFDIGNIISFKSLPGGMINYNYIAQTSKGDFVIRKLGYKMTDPWRHLQKKVEFAVLNYLINNKFPYKIPNFIKSRNGEYIFSYRGVLFEVYPHIKGKTFRTLNKVRLKETAKALAGYHKIIRGLDYSNLITKRDDYNWLFKYYEDMKKVKPKNKLDMLMIKNIYFFQELLNKLSKVKFEDNLLITHADFSQHNLLFAGTKLVGILDFENLKLAPKSSDVAYVLRRQPKHAKMFLEFYKKENSLSKREIYYIPYFQLLDECTMFWWTYMHMFKHPELKHKWLTHTIHNAKAIAKRWEELK